MKNNPILILIILKHLQQKYLFQKFSKHDWPNQA